MTTRCPLQGVAATIVHFSGNRGEAGEKVPAESFAATSNHAMDACSACTADIFMDADKDAPATAGQVVFSPVG